MALKSLLPIPAFGHRSPTPANDARGGELQQELMQRVDRMMESFDTKMPMGGLTGGLDMHETQDAIEVRSFVDGLAANDIEVTLSGSTLAIGSRHDESKELGNGLSHVTQRFVSSVSRRVNLPLEPEPSTITAHLQNGVLCIRIPKAGAAPLKTARIPVTGA